MAASLEQRQIGEQFRILDPPRVPLKAQSPNRLRINGLGTLAGFGLALLLTVLAERRGIRRCGPKPTWRARSTCPCLVLVPFVTTEADLRRQRRRRLMTSIAVVVVSVATGALAWFLQLWRVRRMTSRKWRRDGSD